MVRRILGIVLIVLGAAAIVLGVLSATKWRTSDIVTATTPTAEVPAIVIEPGVAGIVNPQVEIEIRAADPEQTVTLVTARDVDIDGWLEGSAMQRIQDVTDWDVVHATVIEGEQTVPDPLTSDMWTKVEQGDGELTLDITAPQDRTQLMVVRDGDAGPAPSVTFTWHREVTTPYLKPLVWSGAGAAVLGLILLVWSLLPGTRRSLRRKKAARLERRAGGSAGVAAEAEAEAADGSGGADGAGEGTEGAEGVTAAGPAPERDPGPATAETAVLTRRQLRALRSAQPDKPVEEIVAGIGAADTAQQAPDAPEAYPGWLREPVEGGAVEGDGEATQSPQAEEGVAGSTRSGAEEWRRRWGVSRSESDSEADAADVSAETSPVPQAPEVPDAPQTPEPESENEADVAETEADSADAGSAVVDSDPEADTDVSAETPTAPEAGEPEPERSNEEER